MLLWTALLMASWHAAWARGMRSSELEPEADPDRWHERIRTTVFWVGEPGDGTPGGACNRDSAWDTHWIENFGGTDHPRRRNGFFPAGFTPRQNPFYAALPYNDVMRRPQILPAVRWFLDFWKETIRRPPRSRSLCKNSWLAIRFRNNTCFAQWQDVGPVYTDDDSYVFGFKPPKSHALGMAGLDISPAVRDFLKFPGNGKTDWKFFTEDEPPDGPWLEIVTEN